MNHLKFKNGFLYTAFKKIIELLLLVNLVEGFKLIADKITNSGSDYEIRKKRNKRISVDVFIIFKWGIITLFWLCDFNGRITFLMTWYLIITNVYTYFYYHIWDKESLKNVGKDWDLVRRRFINLILAISFSEFSFAYLYAHQYVDEFTWYTYGSQVAQSIWFSVSNSLAANYDAVKIASPLGYSIAMIQLTITFIFITIIVSNSIPQKPEE
jgi:hypothetical protein